ncbi:hypothetical protein CN378_12640 [Bacillus sp. AFS015802]|uniref:hypothetical protein n=1 Tax=Bacillus sp. AFS015802 TaxID=2033486 RepID=UPI000BF7E5E6|nr:hypothetical protein [Bacillus sp. AFS015802]PFA66856.1 hypothetical protein CN378_12640 [Bacillus sp. AFS015802]
MEVLKGEKLLDFSLLFTRFLYNKDREEKFNLALEILKYDFGPEEVMLEAMKSYEYLLTLKFALRKGKAAWIKKGATEMAYRECKDYMKKVKKKFPEIYKNLKI